MKIGHGRLYADVPPVKGVYLGGATSDARRRRDDARLDPAAGALA